MKFTLSWLKNFLATEATLLEITDRLTMLGLEVEKIEDNSLNLSGFKIAKIVAAKPHPKADRLQICHVETKEKILTIICGASNARAGIKVVLAEIGTTIPTGNFQIKKSKIRDIESFGMLCSASELGLNHANDTGIMELSTDAIVGQEIASHLGLDDPVIHINVTPNRADALGVYGIARDLAASGMGILKKPIIPEIKPQFVADLALTNSTTTKFFALRYIKNIRNQASPKWLQNLLNAIGVKTISLIVDITNYITYSFAQPMHVYDADKLTGDLVLDTLQQETNFTALDNQQYKLLPGDLVIRDQKQIQAIAGIIGADNSSCSINTHNILLETACFEAEYIAQTGRRLKIDSQARYRFERYVDSSFTLDALAIATYMIQEICGGEISEVILSGNPQVATKKITFPIKLLKKKINIELETTQILEILSNLGFTYTNTASDIEIIVPSWRDDISIKEDIIEEIIRIHGYDKIKETPLPTPAIGQKILLKEQKRLFDLKRLLALNGYHEIISWSFTNEQKAALFDKLIAELRLQNPISSELNYLRPSILPNLLKIVSSNLNRSITDLSIFEVGPVFADVNNSQTINHAAGIRCGRIAEKNNHHQDREYDVFDIKTDLASILTYSGLDINKCQIKQDAPSYYHPTRSASLSLGKNILGYFGQLHPSILQKFTIDTTLYGFEININKLPFSKDKYGKKAELIISNYQKINRDYAFILPAAQPVGEILNYITNLNRKLIKAVRLFDVYTGDKVIAGKKSIALSVTLQADNRTLTEMDIDNLHQTIITAVTNKFSAKLRDGCLE